MALLTTQNISRTGITPTYAAVAASDTFVPDGQTFLHVKNGGGSPDSVTVATGSGTSPAAGLTVSMAAVSVTNGQERMIGPFPANFFADPTTGLATVTHGFTTSVTVGVFKVSQG
jgi:hypothetical protein